MKRKYYLTYSKELVKEPFIYQVGIKFKVKTNIRQASISEELGIVALELEGDSGEIEKAVQFFVENGVKVEPIELGVIE
ncbi:MAG: NIL domain-containing protein [Proteobacteria bacterium]|nr:NIL domain-containing protein [Pseudomonadota bacterium]